MSFVYAEKKKVINQETIFIHCDTKIGLSEDDITNFSVEEIDLIKKYGIVKISILGATISIAFAGNNIFLAAKLFSRLCEIKCFSVEEAIEEAYDIHKSAKSISDIEFIICSADDNILRIDCIKDGVIQYDCSSAWLGSYQAFRQFQMIRMSDPTKSPAEMTESSFQSIVHGGWDDSVGIFHISASYRPDLKSFWYSEKSSFFSNKEQTVHSGETVKFYLDPSEGGYSYSQIPFGVDCFLLNIDQMDPMILFSRTHRLTESKNNPNLFGLMLPMLVEQKENGEFVRC